MTEANTTDAISAKLSNDFLSRAAVFASAGEVIGRAVSGGRLTFSQLKLLFLVIHIAAPDIGDAGAFLGVTCPAANSKLMEGSEPNAISKQCEIYFREHCPVSELGGRNYFYRTHKTQDRDVYSAGSAERKVKEKVN